MAQQRSVGQIILMGVLALIGLFLMVTIVVPLLKALVSLLLIVVVVGGAIWFAVWAYNKLNDSGR
jgi:hypothetical protein